MNDMERRICEGATENREMCELRKEFTVPERDGWTVEEANWHTSEQEEYAALNGREENIYLTEMSYLKTLKGSVRQRVSGTSADYAF